MFKERNSEKNVSSLSVISSSHGAAARGYSEVVLPLKLLPEHNLFFFFSATP